MNTPTHAAPLVGNVPTMPSPNGSSPAAPSISPDGGLSEEEQIALIRKIRSEEVARFRPRMAAEASPIRLMARMVGDVVRRARREGVSPAVLSREVINCTIGDVNVRLITEKIDGVDYSTIGEDLGLIIPGETIAGRVSTGETHTELNRREDEIERRLLYEYDWDLRIYDVYGVGNPLLREKLANRFEAAWGLPTNPEYTFISVGALDALYKAVLSFGYYFKQKYGTSPTFAFPAPGFAVVNWHAKMAGLPVLNLHTSEESNFKLTYRQLKGALAQNPELRLLYLTVSNNPTAFSYSHSEITDVLRAIEEDGREFVVLADLAYVGTGPVEEDMARMAAFNTPFALQHTLFINSLSKVFTLTGDRCGWVSLHNPEWAEVLRVAWNNMTAGLPAEWQLRFTAYIEWFEEHPEIQEKIKTLYNLRREHFRGLLRELDAQHALFDQIGLDDHTTIYNWSKLKPGEDALSLFEKTGIAGVSGGAFGYTNEYIRFSVGFIPIT